MIRATMLVVLGGVGGLILFAVFMVALWIEAVKIYEGNKK